MQGDHVVARCVVARCDGRGTLRLIGWDGLCEWYEWRARLHLEVGQWVTVVGEERSRVQVGGHRVILMAGARLSRSAVRPTDFERRCVLPSPEIVAALGTAGGRRETFRMAPRESSVKVMRDALRRK